ncbi:unnamed protein product [Soboliphyme baturini]|uniref:Protein kinase domain-containing protein n=1 Tax=Soboliphyme baturini TaxID=241478 RepID=A0A183IL44_9BILA|nr:unnamed protein product [Soboliphyme baturini]
MITTVLVYLSSDPELPRELTEQYRLGRVIGDGNFAVVHECFCRQTNQRYATKIIDKRKSCLKRYLQDEIIHNEIRLMQDLRHPHIVQLYSNFDTQDFICLVMEHVQNAFVVHSSKGIFVFYFVVQGGDLFDSLVRAKRYCENVASHLIQNLVSALEYLHDRRIVHRDVKPENLLVYETADGKKQLKLADFGLATKVDGPLYTVYDLNIPLASQFHYFAGKIFQLSTRVKTAATDLFVSSYGLKVDIWAAGVILYMMLSGFPPFYSPNGKQEELFRIILSGHYRFPPQYWDGISNASKSLIQGMLQFDDADRYSAREGGSQVNADFEEFSALALKDSDAIDCGTERVSDLACSYVMTD